ncbi:hypothetical protein Daura_34035 [Dactylosporangium aurantiacum]|uniref:HEAT repeat domain-containing protein n=1 Tax=Dactylosporangium aurantiacum TaxID=35754 RepID=A0A9Q9MD62_9ACTN|nr:hypothetical protein [Dactylosporangium aurantiacum]MDG6105212.1 hypothetical protein [Dactylosporangium aurantiacum]UWZ51729.1 hypothetical protein Daura_34035 [Dactylosporangium aurantiacum]
MTACVERDHRYHWAVDERAVYLARLVRDLRLPVARLAAVLRGPADEDNAFGNTLDVLVALGRAGDHASVEVLREYVRDGPRWSDVLDVIGGAWPAELWQEWAAEDARVAVLVEASPLPRCPGRPLRDATDEELLAAVRTGGGGSPAALWELRRRGPQPALLDLAAADLPPARLRGPLGAALEELGAAAVPLARQWAARPGHPMAWTAAAILAGHGDESDVPALLAAWAWLDRRGDDLCGYGLLAEGLARIGGSGARAVLPKLRRAWFSPHSSERAACLRAAHTLDPDGCEAPLTEGLWDCERDVRRYAAEHAPLSPLVRDRLAGLRDDPLETAEVRAVAAGRLAA